MIDFLRSNAGTGFESDCDTFCPHWNADGLRSNALRVSLPLVGNLPYLFLALSTYSFDQVNSIQAIANHGAKYFGLSVTDNAYRPLVAFGALLLVIAAFLRRWGTSYLRAEVMRDSQVRTEKLLADGPYRYVRNPLYLRNIFMAVGIGLMPSTTGFFILSVGMTLFVVRLILREESELSRDQDEQYRRYCVAVPRLLPALRPRIQAAGNSPNWAQGFRAESMYWLLALAMAAFAITLNIKVFWGVFAVAIASSWRSTESANRQRISVRHQAEIACSALTSYFLLPARNLA